MFLRASESLPAREFAAYAESANSQDAEGRIKVFGKPPPSNRPRTPPRAPRSTRAEIAEHSAPLPSWQPHGRNGETRADSLASYWPKREAACGTGSKSPSRALDGRWDPAAREMQVAAEMGVREVPRCGRRPRRHAAVPLREMSPKCTVSKLIGSTTADSGGITMLTELRHAKGDQRTLSHEEAAKLLGEAIYLARRRRDISQEQAAHLAEVSVETYVAMEHGYSARGRPANPTLKTLVSVLSALHFELDQLARVIETTDEIGLTPPD